MELYTIVQWRLRWLVLVCIVSFCLCRATFGHQASHTVDENQLADLTRTVDAIDSKLDVLSNTINRKLDTLLGQDDTDDNDNANVDNVTESPEQVVEEAEDDENEDDSPSTPSVDIVSVQRLPAGDQRSKFVVRFTTNADVESDEISVRVYDDYQTPRDPDSIVEDAASGTWLTEFTVDRNASRGAEPWVYLGSTDDYLIGMSLNNHQSQSATQDTVKVPALSTSPALEAVYEPGQNVTVTVTSQNAHFSGNPFNAYFSGVDLLTNKYHFEFEDVDLIDGGERESLPDKVQQTCTVLTALYPVSGLVEITNHETNTGGSLVGQTMVSKYIKVRPSNQSGYLPPGFLGFVDMPYHQRSPSGYELQYCRKVAICKPTCTAVGESISGLHVYRVLPDNVLHQVTTFSTPAIRDNYLRVYWRLNNGVHEGQVLTFECNAFDGVNQNMVSKRINVHIAPGALD